MLINEDPVVIDIHYHEYSNRYTTVRSSVCIGQTDDKRAIVCHVTHPLYCFGEVPTTLEEILLVGEPAKPFGRSGRGKIQDLTSTAASEPATFQYLEFALEKLEWWFPGIISAWDAAEAALERTDPQDL